MTSSKCDFQNRRRFSRAFAEYLENSSTDFHQTFVIFRQSSKEVSEDRSFIVAMITSSSESAALKMMILEKKSGIFLRFRTDTASLS